MATTGVKSVGRVAGGRVVAVVAGVDAGGGCSGGDGAAAAELWPPPPGEAKEAGAVSSAVAAIALVGDAVVVGDPAGGSTGVVAGLSSRIAFAAAVACAFSAAGKGANPRGS